jgi:hypothetical protein
MRKLGRQVKDYLNIQRNRRSRSQSNSRPPSPDTVHRQGMSTNHCPWIRIDPLVKSCRCLNIHHLVSHWHNVAVSLSYDWPPSGLSSRSTGPNPRNDASSGLDGTDRDTGTKYDRLPSGHSSRSADPNPRSDASSGLDGTDRDTIDEELLGKSLLQPT